MTRARTRSLRSDAIPLVLLLTLTAGTVGPLHATEWSVDLEARLRAERFNTPKAREDQDGTYDLGLGRVRLGGEAKAGSWTFAGILQGAAMAGLPDDGAFGIGPVYFAANDGDDGPGQIGMAELLASWQGGPVTVVLGRQPWADGFETSTGVPALDAVKKARIAERLVGNWDWVNVGRRYDGASAAVDGEEIHGAFFLFQPVAGGVEYDRAFERLDDLTVAGATITGKHGAWLPDGEIRLFAIQYDDERPGARSAAGGDVEILTVGGSLLAGNDHRDLVAWLAWQTGDWGPADHAAWALIVEGGWRPDLSWKPHLRVGVSQASGDDAPGGDHESFFNLLPTNHKWYGAMDYNAFSNLRDVYLDLGGTFGPWSATAGLHRFTLVEKADAWYGGSGAFDETPLGYAGRLPAEERFSDSTIGWELDLAVSRSLPRGWRLAAGLSVFEGGDTARDLLEVKDDGSWGFLQLVWGGSLLGSD